MFLQNRIQAAEEMPASTPTCAITVIKPTIRTS